MMDLYDESELNRSRAVYWRLMAMCYDETSSKYKKFGAKGFTVCERWRNSLLAFIEDLGYPPLGAKTRMKGDATVFSRESMRWASDQEKPIERQIEYEGQSLPISKWSERNGVPVSIMEFRLDKLQWSVEQTLTTPINPKNEAIQLLSFRDETKTRREWSDICGISEWEIAKRLSRGWDTEKALTTPMNHSRNFIPYRGEFRQLSEWANLYGLDPKRLYGRLKVGWTIEEALITPLAPKSSNKAKKDYYTNDKSLGTGQKSCDSRGETKSQSEEMTQAVWFGKDAERLNLRGHAKQLDFEEIYDGYIPHTQERIREGTLSEDYKENCVYDLRLTCKKSVSMQIHLGKDNRLYKAYQETVLEIAELIQNEYAQTTVTKNGDCRAVKREGIIALLMPHHITCELDMEVHTDLLIANGTYCEDGKWRSLRDTTVSRPYYMLNYFSTQMAARVQELGYEIRETVTEKGHPSWDLAGYTDEQIKVFSKRSESEAIRTLITKGYSRNDALIATRKAKQVNESLEQMQARWFAEAQEHGIEAIIPENYPINPNVLASEQILANLITSQEVHQ